MDKHSWFVGLALIVMTSTAALAQPGYSWSRSYGGSGDDMGYYVVQKADGGYALGGVFQPQGALDDMYLVLTNADGAAEHTVFYGGSGRDVCQGVVQTPDGGFALAGITDSYGPHNGGYLVKTNAQGDTLWTRTYDCGETMSLGSGQSPPGCIVYTPEDGGYSVSWVYVERIAPDTSMCIYLVKTDAAGDTLWTRRYHSQPGDVSVGFEHIRTSDGGYAISGVWAPSFNDIWAGHTQGIVVKTDANGNAQWIRTIGGPEVEEAHSIVELPQGGYSIAGDSETENYFHFWQAFLTADGDSQSSYIYGPWNCNCRDHIRTQDGNFILVGRTTAYEGDQFFWLKTDADGNLLWMDTSYVYNEQERAYTVVQTADLGYAIAGFNIPEGQSDKDMWLVKMEPDEAVQEWTSGMPRTCALYQNYPNPFNASTQIEFVLARPGWARLEVVDLLGRTVTTLTDQFYAAGAYRVPFDASQLASGVYVYRLQVGETFLSKKMLFIR